MYVPKDFRIPLPLAKAVDFWRDVAAAVAEWGEVFQRVPYIDGIFVPAKTPAAIVNRLNQEVVRILRQSDVKEKFLSRDLDTVGTSPSERTSPSMKFNPSRPNGRMKAPA